MIRLKDILKESITLPIQIGDTILTGRFKNKPVVVKEIGRDANGQPTINGMKMLAFRIKKLMPGQVIEGKTLSIFDFDDTLAKSDAWVYIKHKDGKESKLDPAEFAVYTEQPGDTFDFKDFDSMLKNPIVIKKNFKLLVAQIEKARRTTGRKVTILTARSLGYPIKHFFKTMGLDVYVVPVGSANPQVKADWVEAKIKAGYDTIYFMDDSKKNIDTMNSMLKKYPHVKNKIVHITGS
jgi:hypothetical protein